MKILGDVSVGDVVYLRVDGDYVPFRVMHHGKPSSLYDSSFDGGTILCKDYEGMPYSTKMVSDEEGGKGTYAGSYLHQVLNQTWLGKLDPAMQQMVMEVKLPYRTDTDGEPYEVASGSNGLAAKVWLPSLSETTDIANYDISYGEPYVVEGAMFDYWKDADEEQYGKWRCLDDDENNTGWGTRTPSLYYGESSLAPYFFRMSAHGYGYSIRDNDVDVWPCLVMPDTLVVDSDNHLHLMGAVPVKVSGTWKESSTWCRVGGVWNEATAIAAKVGGSWKE